eukprot:1288999-Prymnesium_polylepis.1
MLTVLLILSAAALASQRAFPGWRPASESAPQAAAAAASPASALGLYSVEPWSDTALGNHRVNLKLTALTGDGVVAWAHVQWRLPGVAVDAQMLQMRSLSGDSIKFHVMSLDNEAVTLLFEPLSCGDGSQPDEVVVGQPTVTTEETCSYQLYYLPFVRTCETGPSRACSTPCKPPARAHSVGAHRYPNSTALTCEPVRPSRQISAQRLT